MHEISHTLFQDLSLVVIGAALLGLVFRFFRLPLLVGYLTAGILMGPHIGLGLISSGESIYTLSEIGLILLMFILGIEIDVRKLMKSGHAILVNGFSQVIGCFLLALLFFYLLGFNQKLGRFDLIYLSFACALSSTMIVVKILSDHMLLNSLASRITLGILVLQDLWVIVFLAIQPNLDQLQGGSLLISVAKASVLIGAATFVAKFFLPKIFRKTARFPELLLLAAMAWCFGLVAFARSLHLSMEMGALVAGVSIASYPYHLDVSAKASSIRDFFIPIFFVALGLQIPVPTASVLVLASAIVFFVLVSRILTIFPMLYVLQHGNRASFIPALNLSQVSEFSLVLSSIGVSYGHIHEDILSAFILALIVTTFISAIAIPKAHPIFRFISPYLEKWHIKDQLVGATFSMDGTTSPLAPNYSIVLLGFYREASSLLRELIGRHSKDSLKDLLVVDINPEAHRDLKEQGVQCKYGDISHIDTLHYLQLDRAKLLVCTIPDYALRGITNLKLLKLLKKITKNPKIIVTAETLELARTMYREGADYVFLPRLISAHYLADIIQVFEVGDEKTLREKAAAHLERWKEVLD